MEGEDRGAWLRVMGGGCLINLFITVLLVLVVAAFFRFSVDSVVLPFLLGAFLSFAGIYFNRKPETVEMSSYRKMFLTSAGILLGSLSTVLLIAGYLLLSGAVF